MVTPIRRGVLKDLQVFQLGLQVLCVLDALVTPSLDQKLQDCERLHAVAYGNSALKACPTQCLIVCVNDIVFCHINTKTIQRSKVSAQHD